MPSSPDNNIIFRSTDLCAQTESRGDRNSTARRDLGRYYWLLKDSIRRVDFTQDEASLICEATQGWKDPWSISPEKSLYFLAVGAIELDELHEKWALDPADLLAKIKNLNAVEAAAVLDACEQFWQNLGGEHPEITKETLLQAGLISS
jgi:hypothetical protein